MTKTQRRISAIIAELSHKPIGQQTRNADGVEHHSVEANIAPRRSCSPALHVPIIPVHRGRPKRNESLGGTPEYSRH
jgi:hypothetical protein